MKIALIVLAGMMAVPLEAVASSYSNTAHDTDNEFSVPKAVFSDKLRLVLAVGLEGTGHEYVLQVDDDLFDTNDHLDRLSDYFLNAGVYHIQSSMGFSVQQYSASLALARNEMRNLAQRGASLPSPGTVMIMHGKYSYPDGMGRNKAFMYLDLRVLAEMAESEGVDFRIIYLRRGVKDMLVANTVHRYFQAYLGDPGHPTPEQQFMEYMQVVLTDIAVVHSFLAELDPAFVVCHDFDLTGDVAQSSRVAEFLAPNAEIATLLMASLLKVATPHSVSTTDLAYEGADVVASRLKSKLDSFESRLCMDVR